MQNVGVGPEFGTAIILYRLPTSNLCGQELNTISRWQTALKISRILESGVAERNFIVIREAVSIFVSRERK